MAGEPTPDRQLGRRAVELGMLSKEDLGQIEEIVAAKTETFASALVAAGKVRAGDLKKLDPEIPEEVAEALADRKNVIGRYVRLNRLGAGGMSEVWRGYDLELRRPLALKFVRAGRGCEADHARLRREALALAQLTHPGIIPVYDAGVHDGRMFLAVKFVNCKRPTDKSFDLRRRVEIARDAARALHFAHEKGFLHRDIKPGNILVEDTGHVYVSDFDLALHVNLPRVTEADWVLGTPTYMSPEQAAGKFDKVDRRSDIYSLGASLYELATDTLPVIGASTYDTMKAVIEEGPVPAKKRNPELPNDLCAVIGTAMAKEPEARYSTAGDLADDLDRWLRGEPVLARRAGLGSALRHVLRTLSPARLLAAILFLLLVAAIVAWRIERARGERLRARVQELEAPAAPR